MVFCSSVSCVCLFWFFVFGCFFFCFVSRFVLLFCCFWVGGFWCRVIFLFFFFFFFGEGGGGVCTPTKQTWLEIKFHQ